jgi:hypothetical protein
MRKHRAVVFVWEPEFKARLAELCCTATRPSEIPAAIRRQLEHEGWNIYTSERKGAAAEA